MADIVSRSGMFFKIFEPVWRMISAFIVDQVLKCFSSGENAVFYRCATPLGMVLIIRKKGWPAINEMKLVPTVFKNTQLILVLDDEPTAEPDRISEVINRELRNESSPANFVDKRCSELGFLAKRHLRKVPPETNRIVITEGDEAVFELPPGELDLRD